MKKTVTLLLFLGFLALACAEVGPKFIAAAKTDGNSALYVSRAEIPSPERKEIPAKTDYQALIKGIDPDGA